MKFNILDNWHLKLLAFFIACIMWFYVVNQQSVQYDINCNINFSNLPKNFIILKDYFKNYNVVITVQGKKNTSLNRKINSLNINLDSEKIDLKKGMNKIELSPDYFKTYIPDNLQIVNINPNSFEFVIDEKFTKSLKVIPEINGEPDKNYKIKNVKINPDKIKITGPKNQLENKNEIKTFPIKITNIVNSIKVESKLDLDKNFLTETDKVSVQIILEKIN